MNEPLFLASATIGAHSTAGSPGFRQKDVRFIFELFTNWLDSKFNTSQISVHNMQISRFLDGLVRDGACRKMGRGLRPSYRLTRVGLIDLLSKIVTEPIYPLDHFLFFFHFLQSYAWRIEQLVTEEGPQFPKALKIELDSLLNVQDFLERQISRLKIEIKNLEVRVNEAIQTSKLASKEKEKGKSLTEVINIVEKSFPYELNNQKPLSELFSSIPADIQIWELTQGNLNRASSLWKPRLQIFQTYLAVLEALKGQLL